MAVIESEIYFRVGFGDGTRLRRWKSTGIPNFDEISQSTAEIKLLPFSENEQPPFWNSISGFYFWTGQDSQKSHKVAIFRLYGEKPPLYRLEPKFAWWVAFPT